MFSSPAREWFQDILDNIGFVEEYLRGVERQSFESDRRTRDAVERCLMRISEAAARLKSEADTHCPEVPWRDIRGLGNQLRHAYHRIDANEIWNIARRDLPKLRDAVSAAVARIDAAG